MELVDSPQDAPPTTFQEEQPELWDQVLELLHKGAVELAPVKSGFFSPMFVIPKKDGGARPIINLKRLNSHLRIQHFKMENILCLRDLLKRGDFMVKLDLKDAYLTIPIHANHRRLLRFMCRGKAYQFCSLPFGLATAPRVFTKVMKPALSALRAQGIRLISYLDDMLIMSSTQSEARIHLEKSITLLERLGFLINWKKSITDPVQSIEFLGLVVDSKSLSLRVPEAKVQKIQKECQALLNKGTVSGRSLAHIIGLLTSVNPAVLPGPLHYRALQRLKNRVLRQSGSLDTLITLDEETRKDLSFWIFDLHTQNGKSIMLPTAQVVISTDASRTGWGATSEGVSLGGHWTREESNQHINFLELKAAFLGLKGFASSLELQHIRLLMDSSTAIAFINKKGGTHSKMLSDLSLLIWSWCLKRKLSIYAEHIPGVLNGLADSLSRRRPDFSDWTLNHHVFEILLKRWGPLDVDLFAARHNTQLKSFFSYHPDPEALASDALAQSWGDLNCYAFPPFVLLGRVLQKIRQERVKKVILIAPNWTAQVWYPALLQLLVDNPLILPQNLDLLRNPLGEPHPLILQGSLNLTAWKVSGLEESSKTYQLMPLISSVQPGEGAQKNLIQ